MVLRFKKQDTPRPFKVPFYPVTPILFTGSCLYMLYASLTVTGNGALLGVALLLAGWIFSFVAGKFKRK
jgi:amino acid transporter